MSEYPADPAEAIVRFGHRLRQDGLSVGTSGNLSVRRGDRIWITPTGARVDELSAAQVAVIDPSGRPLGGEAPSSEAPLHRAIYAARPDVGAVVHTHSPYATVFSLLRRPVLPVHYLLGFAGRQVRVAEYACFGTEALAENTADALGSDGAVLLASHGLVAVGASLPEAYRNALAVEEVARLQHLAEQIGQPVVLEGPELDEVIARLAGYGR